jgi:uncharacterized membrane protein
MTGLRYRFRRVLDRIRESLFYVPALIITGGLALAVGTTWVDSRFNESLQGFPLLIETSVPAARATLGAAAAATITVAGIVISITVVAVQLASSQFSPRVLQGFFRDRFTQVLIGLVIGSFLYDLIGLAAVKVPGTEEPVSSRGVTVTVAIVLAVASVLAIVAFIDRSLRRMQVSELIRRIADATSRLLARDQGHESQVTGEAPAMPDGPGTTVRSSKDGWVLEVDQQSILDGMDPESVARLDIAVGRFVARGSPILTVWPEPAEPARMRKVAQAAIQVGRTRRIESDPSFGIRQLVDIALRALSPGVNDPTTANEVLVHLTGIVRLVLERDQPERVHHGPDGRRLFRPHEPSRTDLVREAFGEIRMGAAAHPPVMSTLLEVLGGLVEHLEAEGLETRTDPLREEARLAVETIERTSSLLPEDRIRVRRTAERLGLVEPADEQE